VPRSTGRPCYRRSRPCVKEAGTLPLEEPNPSLKNLVCILRCAVMWSRLARERCSARCLLKSYLLLRMRAWLQVYLMVLISSC